MGVTEEEKETNQDKKKKMVWGFCLCFETHFKKFQCCIIHEMNNAGRTRVVVEDIRKTKTLGSGKWIHVVVEINNNLICNDKNSGSILQSVSLNKYFSSRASDFSKPLQQNVVFGNWT